VEEDAFEVDLAEAVEGAVDAAGAAEDDGADDVEEAAAFDDEAAADGVALADAETVTASSVFGCGAVPVDDVVVGFA
jgi:hypothetical protein